MNPSPEPEESGIAASFAQALTADDFSESLARYGERAIPFLCERMMTSLLARDILLNLEGEAATRALEDTLREEIKSINLWRSDAFTLLPPKPLRARLAKLAYLLNKRAPHRLSALLEETRRTKSLAASRWANFQRKAFPTRTVPPQQTDHHSQRRFQKLKRVLRVWDFFATLMSGSTIIAYRLLLLFILASCLFSNSRLSDLLVSILMFACSAAFVFLCIHSLITFLMLITRAYSKPAQTAQETIRSRTSLEDLPTLALLNDRIEHADDMILERLKVLDPSNPPDFTSEELNTLHSLMKHKESALVLPLFKLLSVCGNEQTLKKLEAYASAQAHPSKLRQAASQAAEALRHRLTRLQAKRVLLRASGEAHTQEELLRAPNHQDSIPDEMLLRNEPKEP